MEKEKTCPCCQTEMINERYPDPARGGDIVYKDLCCNCGYTREVEGIPSNLDV